MVADRRAVPAPKTIARRRRQRKSVCAAVPPRGAAAMGTVAFLRSAVPRLLETLPASEAAPFHQRIRRRRVSRYRRVEVRPGKKYAQPDKPPRSPSPEHHVAQRRPAQTGHKRRRPTQPSRCASAVCLSRCAGAQAKSHRRRKLYAERVSEALSPQPRPPHEGRYRHWAICLLSSAAAPPPTGMTLVNPGCFSRRRRRRRAGGGSRCAARSQPTTHPADCSGLAARQACAGAAARRLPVVVSRVSTARRRVGRLRSAAGRTAPRQAQSYRRAPSTSGAPRERRGTVDHRPFCRSAPLRGRSLVGTDRLHDLLDSVAPHVYFSWPHQTQPALMDGWSPGRAPSRAAPSTVRVPGQERCRDQSPGALRHRRRLPPD